MKEQSPWWNLKLKLKNETQTSKHKRNQKKTKHKTKLHYSKNNSATEAVLYSHNVVYWFLQAQMMTYFQLKNNNNTN